MRVLKRASKVMPAAVLALGAAAVAAQAQGMMTGMGGPGGFGGRHQQQGSSPAQSQKSKADEKAYESALKSVPNSTKPKDSWQNIR